MFVNYTSLSMARNKSHGTSLRSLPLSLKQHVRSNSMEITTVFYSSTKAEYRSMAPATCKLLWLKSLLSNLDVAYIQSLKLYYDNQVALHITANPVFLKCIKNIKINCHSECIQMCDISTIYILSDH